MHCHVWAEPSPAADQLGWKASRAFSFYCPRKLSMPMEKFLRHRKKLPLIGSFSNGGRIKQRCTGNLFSFDLFIGYLFLLYRRQCTIMQIVILFARAQRSNVWNAKRHLAWTTIKILPQTRITCVRFIYLDFTLERKLRTEKDVSFAIFYICSWGDLTRWGFEEASR